MVTEILQCYLSLRSYVISLQYEMGSSVAGPLSRTVRPNSRTKISRTDEMKALVTKVKVYYIHYKKTISRIKMKLQISRIVFVYFH